MINWLVKLPLILIVLIIGITACDSNDQDDQAEFDYGTNNQAARDNFIKGWEEILDNGRWTESEAAFRKAAKLDPEWLLGMSMVARITQDLEERQEILKKLEANKEQAGPDERLLLDVNIASHIAANNRDQGIANSPESSQLRRQLAEKNFGAFARKYPEDDYFKAEYIEFVHLNHGAQAALDSIGHLANPRQKQLGFYISYAGILELELGNFDKAKALSTKLKATLTDPSFNSPLMLDASIYLAEDNPQKALDLVNQVVARDSNHIIAKGMQAQLQQILAKQ